MRTRELIRHANDREQVQLKAARDYITMALNAPNKDEYLQALRNVSANIKFARLRSL